jgi:TRAP-type C4-dicarboxylate transport system substrate-binding protein
LGKSKLNKKGIIVSNPKPDEPIELTAISHLPITGESAKYQEYYLRWFRAVNAELKGRLHMRVIGGPEVLNPKEQLAAVRAGQFDILVAVDQYYSEFKNMHFAYWLDPWVKASHIYANLDFLREIAQKDSGVNPVYVFMHSAPSYLLTVDKPVTKAADLKGMTIRTIGTLVEALPAETGCATVSIAPSAAAYSGLKEKSIDGTICSVTMIGRDKLGEVAKFMTYGAPIFWSGGYVFMRNEAWNALPVDIQKTLTLMGVYESVKDLARQYAEDKEAEVIAREKYDVTFLQAEPDLAQAMLRVRQRIMNQSLNGNPYRAELEKRFGLK